MVKRRRNEDSDGKLTAAATYNTVFIDSSLDTHLAMIVSESDTVSILKGNVVVEHARCFPRFGEIKIDALKVKRKGFFYHLPDHMRVTSAFDGVKKSWFLYIDVSMLKMDDETRPLVKFDERNQKALACIVHCPQGHYQQDFLADDRSKTPSPVRGSANGKVPSSLAFEAEVSKGIANGVGCNVDAQFNDPSPTSSKTSVLRVQKSGLVFVNKNNRVSETIPGCEDDKLIGGVGNNCTSTIQFLETANPAKKHNNQNVTSAREGNGIELGHLDEADKSVENTGNSSVPKRKMRKIQSSEEFGREILHINDKKVEEEITALNNRVEEVETLPKEQENEKAHIELTGRKKGSKNTKNVETKSKRKSKKNRTPAPDDRSSLPINNQVASERCGEVDTSSKVNEEITALDDGAEVVTTLSKEQENEEADIQLTQVKRSAENTENAGRKSKKKSKKNPIPAADDPSSLPINGRAAVAHEGDIKLKAFDDGAKELKNPSKELENKKADNDIQLTQVKREAENTENVRRKSKKKSKRNRTPASDDASSLPINDHAAVGYVGDIEITALDDGAEEVKTPSKEQENEKADIQLTQVKRSAEDTENLGRKSKKKSERKHTAAAGGQSSLPINDQGAGGNGGGIASERCREVDAFCKVNEEITALNSRGKEVETPPGKEENEDKDMQLTQMKKSAENTENVERKLKKKSKKKQIATASDQSSLPINDQGAGGYVGGIEAEKFGEVDTLSEAPVSLVHRPLVLDPENKTQGIAASVSRKAKVTGILKDLVVSEDIAGPTDKSKEVESPSETSKDKRKYHQSAVTDSDFQNVAVENKFDGIESEANADDLAKVAANEGGKINFKQYFVPGEHQSEVVTKPNTETIAEGKAEKNFVPSVGTTPHLQQDFLKSVKKKEDVVTSVDEASKGIEIKKMVKHILPHASATFDLENFKTPQKHAAPAVSAGANMSVPGRLMGNDKSLVESSSSSSSESSKMVPRKEMRKKASGLKHSVIHSTASTKLRAEVVSGLKQDKSLLRTPVSIFKDVSNESSSDENGLVDSDAGTRSPSDNSASSGYSSDGSDASANSTKNGAGGVERKEAKRKGVSVPELSSLKQIPMDAIFRSSSRFKKAKLTASQELEDTEDHPIEFVPDSQAQE